MSQFRVGVFPSSKPHSNLYFVPITNELPYSPLFYIKVMYVRSWTHFDLFDLNNGLFFPGFLGLFALLVLELPVIHETNNGWPGLWSNLHEVEFQLRCKPPRFLDRLDTDLTTIRVDEANLFDSNLFVDPGLLDRSTSCSYVLTKQAPGAITKAARRECCLVVRPGTPESVTGWETDASALSVVTERLGRAVS